MTSNDELQGFERIPFQQSVMRYTKRLSLAEVTDVSDIAANFILPALQLIAKSATTINDFFPSNESASRDIEQLLDQTHAFTEEVSVTLFGWTYRVAVEVVFRADSALKTQPGVVNSLHLLISRVRYNEIRHGELVENMMIYPDRILPSDILKEQLERPDFQSMAAFCSDYAKLEEAGENLKRKHAQVKALSDTLDKYKVKFNFVGLHEGFEKISYKKRVAVRLHVLVMLTLFFFMVAPFVYKAWLIMNPSSTMAQILAYHLSSSVSKDATDGMMSFLSDRNFGLLLLAAGYELLMLYFFRVVFSGYRSVQAQLVQIELRMTLCQFIQNYTEYSKSMSKEAPGVLDRFEQLIFSGIVANEDQIPSSFDGVDQITKLFSQIGSAK